MPRQSADPRRDLIVSATDIDHGAGLVVVGASLAGLRAAESARQAGYEGPITLVGDEFHLPYDRPPLSKQFLKDGAEVDFHTTTEELAALDVKLLLGAPATQLDPTSHRVRVGDSDWIPYEKLIIATGASPRSLPNTPDLDGVIALRTIDDALALRERLRPGTKLVIVGAGFIGSELASSARDRGADVTIVEAAPIPLVRAVGATVGQALAKLHERNGIPILCDVQVEELIGTIHVEAVRLSTGTSLPAELVVVGVGATPATGWLANSGIELHPVDGGVIANEFLRTSLEDVYAAGDVVHWPNPAFDGLPVRLENWTNAADQANQAAVNAVAPEDAKPYETVPYFWSDWYESRIQFVGTAVADEVVFASGDPEADKFVALYRSGDRLVGAATLNEQRKIMKLRRIIANKGTYADALELLDPTEKKS
ncbi:Rhodocoxin reductase [Rhodococcus erythropolis]|nr:Rhodocoxin reductase [Rhodococcus erythropolis]